MKTKKTANDRKQNFNWILICMVVGALLGMASVSLGAGDTWTQKADMPTARLGLTTAVVNGKIYAIGGYARANSPAMKTVEEYDPATDTWTTKADMPTARMWLSASVVDGKIYAIGGWVNFWDPGISTVEEYDPSTDTWTHKADIPTARFGLATSVVDGMIYAIGGGTTPSEQLRTVEAYDPLTDTWTTKTDMPSPARMFHSTSVVDGKIYVIGGGGSSPNIVFSSVEEYDPATDTWTTITNMPEPRFALSSITVNGKIYVIGGRSGDQRFSTVEEYDPVTDIWSSKASLPRPNGAVSAGEVNGKIYVIGGTEGATSSLLHPGIRTVYEYDATPPLVVDINGDGIVDIEDLLILIENWGRNEPSVDIAPLPFGDGLVDALDLEVLMSYWEQRAEDVTAHWALDETQGVVAHDSIGNNNGTIHGKPFWQPLGGKLGGALEFRGIDDYISTPFVLNSMKGSFSVFAWIKGGESGQVIISQTGEFGENWLGISTSEGRLMTGLCDVYFDPLESEAEITDGQWHHVGLVYDLDVFHRRLYVDGILVAEDTLAVAGSPSDDGLYIGASKDLEAGSFFSGLIDDVRIYKRAIIP